MARVLLLFAALIFLAAPALAQPPTMTIDLAEDSVNITTGFNGGKIIVYGSTKQIGDLAVVIRGPSRPMIVRRKSQIFGIWMNRQSVSFENVPVYYDFALSRPENEIAAMSLRREHDIGLDALVLQANDNREEDALNPFREALIRNRQAEGLYALEPSKITFLDRDFFRTSFYLPSNVPTGIYTLQAFHFRDGKLVESQSRDFKVGQTGLSASVFLFAYKNGFLYGLTAVLMALISGWGAYAILRRE